MWVYNLLESYLITPTTRTTSIIGVGYAWIGAQGVVSVYVAIAMRSHYLNKTSLAY